MRPVTVTTAAGKFGQRIEIGNHVLPADEPQASGGDDTGPAPHELLLSALGACTSMTVKVYADRKAWPLRTVTVHLTGQKAADGAYEIDRKIVLDGDLDAEQRARLLEIAGKCPVHRTLTGEIRIATAEITPER
jgi:putative redox protein